MSATIVVTPSHDAEAEAKAKAAADAAALAATDAAAKAKADAEAAAKAAGEKKEEKLILGKFKTQADLEAAYAELEKKQSGGKAAEEAAAKAAADAAAKKQTDDQAAATAKAAADAAAATASEAQAAADRIELNKVVGGTEADLETLYAWVAANLSKEEIAGYNALVSGATRNIPAAKVMLDSFVNQFNAAYGRDPKAFVAANAQIVASGVTGYADRAEMQADMSNPMYEKSEAFRQKVMDRLAATTAW